MTDDTVKFADATRARLTARRKMLGLPQQAIADATGAPRSSVAMYESGRLHGALDFVVSYASAVGYRFELAYNGQPGVQRVDGRWYFEGIEYPSRAAARAAADAAG